MFIHPSREERSDCSKPKGEYLHSSYLHTKFSQSDDNSRVPTCLRAQYTFSASVPVLTTTSVQVSQDNCNHPSSEIIPDLPVTLHNCPNSGQRKKHENKLTAKFPVSFQVQFKTISTSYTVQVVSTDLQYYMLNSNTFTTAAQTTDATWCIWEIKINIPKQVVSTCLFLSHSVANQQSQHQVPLCLQCHDGSYFSLSQHSSTYTARQTTMLQASISRLPVSANIRQAPLLLHTTEPQVFNYSRLISQMWQLNQGHWQSKLDPPGSHANVSQMWQLNQGHRPSRFSCQRFPNVATKPRSLTTQTRPSRLSCQRFSGSTTTWPTCRDVTLSHNTF